MSLYYAEVSKFTKTLRCPITNYQLRITHYPFYPLETGPVITFDTIAECDARTTRGLYNRRFHGEKRSNRTVSIQEMKLT